MARSRLSKGVAMILVAIVTMSACSSGGESASSSTATTAEDSSAAAATWTVITPTQLEDMMAKQNVYLVNVHVPFEGQIAGTDAFIPYTDIAGRLDELPFAKQPVVIYCRSGNMSTEAAQAMVDAGAPQFYELGGGFYAWQDAGYPLQLEQS